VTVEQGNGHASAGVHDYGAVHLTGGGFGAAPGSGGQEVVHKVDLLDKNGPVQEDAEGGVVLATMQGWHDHRARAGMLVAVAPNEEPIGCDPVLPKVARRCTGV
jgi:hypothetical protein